MKEMLYQFTKKVCFSSNNSQNDGVALGSSLVPVLANIFMAEHKKFCNTLS